MLVLLVLLLLLTPTLPFRSAAGVDVVPTFTTSNARICLLLSNGKYGALRIEDAERLQVRGLWVWARSIRVLGCRV
jgi:hypothetical protein